LSAAAKADDDPYLTPEEVSARYKGRISVRTLSNWRSSKNGPRYTKLGGAVMYKLSWLVEWEEKRSATNTSEYRRN